LNSVGTSGILSAPNTLTVLLRQVYSFMLQLTAIGQQIHHRKLISIPVVPISNALAMLDCKESSANRIPESSVETTEILYRKFCFRQSSES
jgi:hypothetical protein